MSYCNIGDTPKVTYQFSGSQPVEYLSPTPTSPIDVSTGTSNPTGTTSNYNPNGYQISFPSPQAAFGTFTQTVIDYSTRQGNNGSVLDPQIVTYVKFIPCGGSSFGGEIIASGTITIDSTIHCPVTSSGNQCQITISSNGNQLFKATGNCPVTFNVACGGRCPEGQCECHSDSYPGYCCQDCASTAAQISIMINELKGKNSR